MDYRLLVSAILVIMAGFYVDAREVAGKGQTRLSGSGVARLLLGLALILWGVVSLTMWLNTRQHFMTDAVIRLLLGTRTYLAGVATGILAVLACTGTVAGGDPKR